MDFHELELMGDLLSIGILNLEKGLGEYPLKGVCLVEHNLLRVKDSTYHKEKMLLCKQAEKGVQLQAEKSDWLADKDEEIDEQELEAHYSYMEKIQEGPNTDSGTDAEPLK
ncbi:hypothetical protein Tco_1159477 [Tanacetum coccineum]